MNLDLTRPVKNAYIPPTPASMASKERRELYEHTEEQVEPRCEAKSGKASDNEGIADNIGEKTGSGDSTQENAEEGSTAEANDNGDIEESDKNPDQAERSQHDVTFHIDVEEGSALVMGISDGSRNRSDSTDGETSGTGVKPARKSVSIEQLLSDIFLDPSAESSSEEGAPLAAQDDDSPIWSKSSSQSSQIGTYFSEEVANENEEAPGVKLGEIPTLIDGDRGGISNGQGENIHEEVRIPSEDFADNRIPELDEGTFLGDIDQAETMRAVEDFWNENVDMTEILESSPERLRLEVLRRSGILSYSVDEGNAELPQENYEEGQEYWINISDLDDPSEDTRSMFCDFSFTDSRVNLEDEVSYISESESDEEIPRKIQYLQYLGHFTAIVDSFKTYLLDSRVAKLVKCFLGGLYDILEDAFRPTLYLLFVLVPELKPIIESLRLELDSTVLHWFHTNRLFKGLRGITPTPSRIRLNSPIDIIMGTSKYASLRKMVSTAKQLRSMSTKAISTKTEPSETRNSVIFGTKCQKKLHPIDE
ncbi:hypothetical protein CJJ07_003273 [Candidozyma auris]|nr:hypothetical protein CJJ07_003273 [[Candida] auris]